MNNKSANLLLFFGSVGLILVAIVFTIVIEKESGSKTNTTRQDTRARASQSENMKFTGTVGSYDEENRILIVSELKFQDGTDKSLGTFNITPPDDFSFSKFPSGTKVVISASAPSFKITDKSLTAVEIKKY